MRGAGADGKGMASAPARLLLTIRGRGLTEALLRDVQRTVARMEARKREKGKRRGAASPPRPPLEDEVEWLLRELGAGPPSDGEQGSERSDEGEEASEASEKAEEASDAEAARGAAVAGAASGLMWPSASEGAAAEAGLRALLEGVGQ
jgi:hypothetical protein